MTKPIILVTGATGQQGGGVVNALLADGTFAVRGLTRNTESSAAKALKEKGVEVVQGDADNYDSILKALEGAHGAYFVTNYWDHLSHTREIQQAKNYAQAAKASGLKHAIWSTLDDTRNALKGKFEPLVDDLITPHFDAKSIADQEFVNSGVPTTFLLTSMYFDNFVSFGMGPKKGPDGKYVLGFPFPQDVPLVFISVSDIGLAVVGALKNSSEYINKRVGLAGDFKTISELAKGFSSTFGIDVAPVTFPREVYLSFGFPGVEDMANMFAWYATEDFLKSRSIEETNKVSAPGKFKTFEEWLEANKDKLRANL
eukprot:TRINITY_DN75_c0_g1_i1.p1 TRINITY_DN75_c0_g1~~TRINITY_DN75_c0_g1_i1.p1  ORF type:complete len:356 (-),score=108.09 TRINITY_DN75_c0_g1_i1:62-1000(-)